MAAVRSVNTTPERRLRSALHRMGVRYRLGQTIRAGDKRVKPDIVFKRAGLVVFVDGCFWHGCPEHCRMPGSNVGYWNPKFERNQTRDRRTDDALREAGWTVVRIWEHEDPVAAADTIAHLLGRGDFSAP